MTRSYKLEARTSRKSKPLVLIFSGYGLNTEDETKIAFEMAGASADIVHINDIIARPAILKQVQIVVFPGGFSYGDDTGSGKAYANRVKQHLGEALEKFLARDTLAIGICNGFQIITNAGILPGALIANDSARYICRWVDLEVEGIVLGSLESRPYQFQSRMEKENIMRRKKRLLSSRAKMQSRSDILKARHQSTSAYLQIQTARF